MGTPTAFPSEQLRNLIRENETEQACLQLCQLAKGKLNRFAVQSNLLHARINRLQDEVNMRILSQDDEERKQNQIIKDLLDLISQMEEACGQPSKGIMPGAPAEVESAPAPLPKSGKPEPRPSPEPSRFFTKPIASALLVFAVLIAGWAAVTFFKNGDKTTPPAPFNLVIEVRMASGFEKFQPRGEAQLAFGSEVFPTKWQVVAGVPAKLENVPGKFWEDSIRLRTEGLRQNFKVVRQSAPAAAQGTELVFELQPVFEKYAGKVVRFDSGEPVAGAIITIGNNLASDTTDRAGSFELNLAEKEVSVQINIRHSSGQMTEEILLDKARLQRLKFKPGGN